MSIFLTGTAGCGKTAELLRRAREAARARRILVTSPASSSLEVLRDAAGALPGARVCALHDLALEMLPHAELIDDVRAAELFEDAAAPLFDLSWVEFLETDLDFEVPGLRAPERFANAAFRLFCKLRDALIAPEAFLESAQRGATEFYAKPPNLAGADLLHYTKDAYRDSLAAGTSELNRQFKHELDLAKILTKLYRTYLEHPVLAGCLTARDAIAQGVVRLREHPAAAAALRASYPAAFVDDAQEMTIGELTFLQAVYGEGLHDVTLAFDRESTTSAFRGARPDRVFAVPGERIALEEQRRNPAAVQAAARHLSALSGAAPPCPPGETPLQLFRATTQAAETHFIADYVAGLLREGAAPGSIALLFRSVESVDAYCDALLHRNIPVQIAGDVNVYAQPYALDALALLWTIYDPFRHDYLLRVLQGGVLRLPDAAVQTLCAEAGDSQTALFNDVPGVSALRSGRWDAKRDVRLGLNVLRGERDAHLTPSCRVRLQAFRAARENWLEMLRSASVPRLVRAVWSQGLAAALPPQSAAAAYQQQTLARIMRRIVAFARKHPESSLGEFLEDAERRMLSSFETSETSERADAVRILCIEAARGREFDHVILPNARAGSFPRWYVPDAFLYSPSLGMIAKENVGDASAARTAKFTYYMWRTKTREAYNLQERRAFVYGLRRARISALVTAAGRPTRGVAAPEFLAELQAAGLPGVQDFSDRWRPSHDSLRA
ncbi:MAG: 3'-5' exonuclease [Candidatus Baltobacteraceae bacterium]